MSHSKKGSIKDRMLAETILKLHRSLLHALELDDLSERISEPVSDLIPFDKLCVFLSGRHDSSPSLMTRDMASLPWDRIYPRITAEEMRSSVIYRGKPGDIFLSQDMKGAGCEGDEKVLGIVYQETGYRYSLHLILSLDYNIRLFLTMFRMNKRFNRNDAENLGRISPGLMISARALLSESLSCSGNMLLCASDDRASYHLLLLDHNLDTIDLSASTGNFLKTHFSDSRVMGLPLRLREWLESCKIMDTSLNRQREWHTTFNSDTGIIECSVYTRMDTSGKPITLVALNQSIEEYDFKALLSEGLSHREISVLEKLYAGKSNVQIGDLLGIKVFTVRKHLQSIGYKLHAFNRTEILAKAVSTCERISTKQKSSESKQVKSCINRIQQYPINIDFRPEAVLELQRSLALLYNFEIAPERLKKFFAKHLNTDWIALYCSGAENSLEKIFMSKGPKCNWERLFMSMKDSIRWPPVILDGALGEAFRSHDLIDCSNEQDVFMKTVMEESTGAFHDLCMPIARTSEHSVHIGFYRNDPERPFTDEDVALVEMLSPVLISWAHSVVSIRESATRIFGSGYVLEKGRVQAVLLDRNLCDLMWTGHSLRMLKIQIGPSWREVLMPSIRKWLRDTVLLKERGRKKRAESFEHLLLDKYNLECCAHPLEEFILIIFKRHISDPLFILKKFGITQREIEVISFLHLGYTNSQIASALEIQEITVKKHFESISQKMGVTGRTAILTHADKLKHSINN